MEREEVGMMWHCPCCETKGDNLFGDFRVSWHPEKHGREHIPFPVQTKKHSAGSFLKLLSDMMKMKSLCFRAVPSIFLPKVQSVQLFCMACECQHISPVLCPWVHTFSFQMASGAEGLPDTHFRNPQLLPGHQICINCLVSAISEYLDTSFPNPTVF